MFHDSGVGPIGDHYENFTPLEIELAFGATIERPAIASWLDDQTKRDRWQKFVGTARAAAADGGTVA